MFRFLFRFIGLVMLTLAFLFLVHDGTKSIADQTIYISKMGPTWENVNQSSLSALEHSVEKLLGASVWNDLVQPYFLKQPTSLVIAIVGALFVLLGEKKRRLIGYARD